MRELLKRWAELEPEKIDGEYWDDPVTGGAGSEFRIAGVAVYSDLFEIGENDPALIQWAVQEAIKDKNWWFSLSKATDGAGYWGRVKIAAFGAYNDDPAAALLAAYLEALEK